MESLRVKKDNNFSEGERKSNMGSCRLLKILYPLKESTFL